MKNDINLGHTKSRDFYTFTLDIDTFVRYMRLQTSDRCRSTTAEHLLLRIVYVRSCVAVMMCCDAVRGLCRIRDGSKKTRTSRLVSSQVRQGVNWRDCSHRYWASKPIWGSVGYLLTDGRVCSVVLLFE